LLSPKPTDDDKASVVAAEQRRALYAWVGAAGIGLAVLVGWSSPTIATFLFLGGALLVLGLLLLLGRQAAKMPRLSIRVHSGLAAMTITLCCCAALGEVALRLLLYQSFPDYSRIARRETLGYQYDSILGWFPPPNGRGTHTQIAFHTVSYV
jgi:hypothetical protein